MGSRVRGYIYDQIKDYDMLKSYELAWITICQNKKTEKLTDMTLIPHSHSGMTGSIQKHMLIYIVVIAITLTIFFDLSRIASIGAIFYLVMDMIFIGVSLNI